MGFFSWKTQDTGRSITNNSSNARATFRVCMTDDKGNRYIEDDYEGYGEFGGKDYYELLAEMNGKTTRDEGIDLQFKDRTVNVKFPNLSESIEWEWIFSEPETCEFQGYFYDDDDDEMEPEY